MERADTSEVELVATWTRLAGAGPARISGLVTEFRLGRDASALAAVPGLLLPVPFAATEAHETRATEIDPPTAGACALAALALAPLRELFVAVPKEVSRGTAWTDTAAYTLCRDSIPLLVRVERRYVVVGAERRNGESVLLLDRVSRTRMSGAGSQFGEPIEISADGSAAMRLAVRLAGGVVSHGVGDAILEMRMRGRHRAQELRQHTRIEIDAR